MGRRKIEEQTVRKLSKVGGGKSFCLTIPIDMVRRLGWRERQKVEVRLKAGKIILNDWRRR